jgi:hypothetical protein
MADRYNLHCPAAMHFHRGFGDADIVGNLFAQAAARDMNGNWWKWTTLCAPCGCLESA